MTQTAQTVPAGYKQTEIGVIPMDWDVMNLGKAAYITKLAGYEYTNHFNSYKDGGEIIVIRGTNITNDKLDLSDVRKIPRSTSNKLPRSKLSKEDLVFAYVGTIGPVFLIDENNKYHLGPNTCKITAENNLDPKYLFLYFKSSLIESEIKEQTSIGAQPSLSMTKIRKFRIIIPKNPKEQTAIATVLSDTDALIENLEKLIGKKRAIKQGAMQQLLTGKKRLPGFSGEWEVKELASLGTFKGGSGFPLRYQGMKEGDYPFYKVSDMNNEGNSTFMFDSNHWVSETIRKQSGANTFPINTIVFAKIGAAIFLERKKILSQESCIDNNMMGFVLNETTANARFIHYLFLSIKLGKLVSATALPSLNGKEIGQLIFGIPELPEQTAIATVLSDMDAELEKLENKLQKYRQIRTGMMQQLLTGKIRIYEQSN